MELLVASYDATAKHLGGDAIGAGKRSAEAVVEIPLLLPAARVEALLDLARERHESVGQLLRGWIDRALADSLIQG